MDHELKPQLVIEPVLNAGYDRSKFEAKFRELVTALNKANTNVEYDLVISDDDIYTIAMTSRMATKEENIMTHNNEADLLDSLKDGDITMTETSIEAPDYAGKSIDLTLLNDAELDELRRDVAFEQEKRNGGTIYITADLWPTTLPGDQA